MDFLQFLNDSPTPLHTVQNIKQILNGIDFKQHTPVIYALGEGSLIIALKPKQNPTQIKAAFAHTDSPTLKLKSQANQSCANLSKLNIEVYGGVLYNSWLDRDLGIAGVIYFESQNGIESKLIKLPLGLRIPQLAIHLDRQVNTDGLKLNPQIHLSPVVGYSPQSILSLLQQEIPQAQSILSYDLALYDLQNAALGGVENDFLYSARLDNLSSCYSILEGLKQADLHQDTLYLAGFYNHEEVGSHSKEGADSSQTQLFLQEILESYHLDLAAQREIRSKSWALSLDMAHALHPNYPERHDPTHHPILGQGPVLKINANQRYATDARTVASIKSVAQKQKIPLQIFHARNDMGCGSTVGPTLSASLGISTLDLGAPMLSMHSIREMMSIQDQKEMNRLLQAFLSCAL